MRSDLRLKTVRASKPPSAPAPSSSALRSTLTVAMLLMLLTTLTACRKESTTSKAADVAYYTCTMHPSVRSQNPKGKCPICGMDLVPVMKKSQKTPTEPKAENAAPSNAPTLHASIPPLSPTNALLTSPEPPGEFSIPATRLQQIGVTYATVQKRKLERAIRTAGFVAYDRQKRWEYVARIEGYVQKLFVSSRGETVEKSAPILNIYSPELLTTENEFLDLLKTRDESRHNPNPSAPDATERLLESARQRFRLWNISDEQISAIEKSGRAQEYLTLYSPFRGVVQEIAADQGAKVMIGERLVNIVDLSAVWIWAEFYQEDAPLLKKGLPVTITASSYPSESFSGTVSLVDPFINDLLRTTRVRIDVENPQLRLRPDMYVDVELRIDGGEDLAIPVSAVLPTGARNIAFVDKGEGKLEARLLQLGRKYGDFYELKSGVNEGERVVTSANFLIDAEAKIQGALKE